MLLNRQAVLTALLGVPINRSVLVDPMVALLKANSSGST